MSTRVESIEGKQGQVSSCELLSLDPLIRSPIR